MNAPTQVAADLLAYVENFRRRVLQDALAEATNTYWLRRAEAFHGAEPRDSDYVGHASLESLVRRGRDLQLLELACRQRAAVATLTVEAESGDLIAVALAEVGQ